MRYEEVETVLPSDIQSTTPTTTSKSTSGKAKSLPNLTAAKTNSERRSMIQRLRGIWKTSRKKLKKQSASFSDANAATSGDHTEQGVEGSNLKKVDSNATEPRSNTTKNKAEERDADSVTNKSLPSIREGSPNVQELSIEIKGEEEVEVEVGILSHVNSSVTIGEKNSFDTTDAVGDVDNVGEVRKKSPPPEPVLIAEEEEKVGNETSSSTLTSSQVQVTSSSALETPIVEDVDEASLASENQIVKAPENALSTPASLQAQDSKWAKKVSISIAGYKTSFQFSDPIPNLAQKVNEALDVVNSDSALIKQATQLDDIGNKIEEERDYDVNPTKLFVYLQQKAWGLASDQLELAPDEAKIWVYRKLSVKPAENVEDGYNSKAMVVSSQELVVHDGNVDKLRWKLLPLHASIVLGAPLEIIMGIIKVYPNAARMPDERGSLPVHLAASRLDVDPEGEKVVLQLFGAYPDSIHAQDRKGRTPQELAKLARGRKEAEIERRLNAENIHEIEKTASDFHVHNDDDDDGSSVKSGISQRFKMMLKKSMSTDTVDRRKKCKKKCEDTSDSVSVASLSKARSVDTDCDVMGPGFAILKPAVISELSPRSLMDDDKSEEGSMPALATTGSFYTPPSLALATTDTARSIPLPQSFSVGEDDTASVRSSNSKASAKSTGSKTKMSALDMVSPKSLPSVETLPPTPISGETKADGDVEDSTKDLSAETVNESLRLLLEKAAENVGRANEDVTPYMKDLEDEWVTDVEALRRLDGETLDALLPIVLSREVQQLISQADNIDDKFLTDDQDTELGKWVKSHKIPERTESSRGRSSSRKGKKKSKRSVRKLKKSSSSLPPRDSLNAIAEEFDSKNWFDDEEDTQTVYTIKTEAPSTVCPTPVQSHASSKVRIHETPTDVKEFDYDEQQIDSELEIRKMHVQLIADARKKFPTREKLEDAIRERQQEVEAAVNSGFNVDKQTLSRAALADDEVRRLLPLRLILPSLQDLTEMIGVLQIHKENALRNSNIKKANKLQGEIDELEFQLDLEKKYILQRKLDIANSSQKCISCGEPFTPENKMVGILKTKEYKCPNCRGSLISSLIGSGSGYASKKESQLVEKQEEMVVKPVQIKQNDSAVGDTKFDAKPEIDEKS